MCVRGMWREKEMECVGWIVVDFVGGRRGKRFFVGRMKSFREIA